MKHRRHNTYARFVAPSKFEPDYVETNPWWEDHERVRRMTEGRRVLECPPLNHQEHDHAYS